ncbi:hypothetical protein [Clostridium beijerinckii]|uniref:Uncharacterized protein n=1 Tax=Clostridium beijerinckii TaxID=1520 RepID=A0A1S8SKI2_CLOBE|nr:hypothetical protein [Clostridium beijerinckii]NRY63817.1 cbb3-type cytochrome oxidase subunit 3 [Clostridium beijerinckii]OOM66053.1 hypothetical protein CLBCK_00090 [Clostridium beijerinckii]
MRKVDLKTKELFQNGLSGIAWIAIGASRIWGNNVILSILVIAFLVPSIVVNVMAYVAKRREANNYEYIENEDEEQEESDESEEDDEDGGEYDEDNVEHIIYDFSNLGILLCLIITSIKNTWSVDLNIVIPILIGSILLIRDIQSIFYNKTNC